MMTDLFGQIQEERDRIMLASLLDVPRDYSKLRKLCSQMNEGSDEELWQSVMEYYRQFLG